MNPASKAFQSRTEMVQDTDVVVITEVLRRFKWTLAAWILLSVFLGGYYAFSVLPPRYTATTVVVLQSSRSNIVDFESVAPDLTADYWSITTEVEVLRARNLMAKVVEKEALIEDPEFNHYLRAEIAKAENPDGSLFDQLLRAVSDKTELTQPPTSEQVRHAVIDSFLRSVRIENVKSTRAFNINVTTLDPAKSARLADSLAESYILNQLEAKFSATQQATAWLTDRVAQLKLALEESEAAVKAVNSEVELVSAESLSVLNRQLKDYRSRATGFEEQIEVLNNRQTAIEGARAEGDLALIAQVTDDAGLKQLASRLTGQDDPLRETFDQRVDQVLEATKFQAGRAQAQLATLRSTIADLEARSERQSTDLVRLEQLQREAEANEVIYEYFLGRLREASAQPGIQQADSTILSNAVPPSFPSSPNKALILIVALVLGVFFGLLHIARKQMKSRDFRSSLEIEQFTGIRVVGRIPEVSATRPGKLLKYLREKPVSAFAEMIRDLRTSIMLSNVDQEPQVVMLASSIAGEGKTTQSVALAASYASMPKSVLLIDCDLRRRTISAFFDLPERSGLVSAVVGRTKLDQAIHFDAESGIHVLPADSTNVNAADFFASDRFRDLLSQLRLEYDVIVIDTPPVLVVPEARLVAQHADCVIYSVRWGKTLKRMVQQGVALLNDVGVEVSGITMNMIDQREATRYGEYHGRYDRKYHVA